MSPEAARLRSISDPHHHDYICTNDVNPTLFCNEEGYDVIPLQMVNVLPVQDEDYLLPKSSIEPSLEVEVRHVEIENEISTFEISFGHETQGENYYNASNELDYSDPLDIHENKDQPIIFKTQESKEIELP